MKRILRVQASFSLVALFLFAACHFSVVNSFAQVRRGRLPDTCPTNAPLVRLNPTTQEWLCMAMPPEMDNQLLSSSVDASGNPNFLATGSGLTLNINGATTNLRLLIAGQYQILKSDVSITLTASSNQFVYATQNLRTSALVAADFGASALPPDYDYVAPAGPATDQHWFDLSRNQMYRYSGAAWVAVNRIFLGVARTSGAAIDGVVCEPYRLSPQKRFELFGDASDGILTVTDATALSGTKNYSFVRIQGATLSLLNSGTGGWPFDREWFGLRIKSQNPILIIASGIVTSARAAGANKAGTTGVGGGGGNGGWFGGVGGGGGGSSANAGGSGGAWSQPYTPSTVGTYGGAGGGINTAGGAGAVNLGWSWQDVNQLMGFCGTTAGAGGGDGVNNGGDGGAGALGFWLRGPSVLIDATSSATAKGNNGTAGVAGNAGGGGGGGGGFVTVQGGFVNNLGTISAAGGTGGAGVGTGGAGGAGGAGTALAVRLW